MMSTYCGLKTSCSGSGCSWLTNLPCVSFPRKYKPTRISGKLFSDGWNSLWLARVGTVVCWRDLCRMVQTLSQLGSVNSDCSWLSPCPEIGQRSCLFQGSILYSNAGQYRGGRNIWNCSHLASTGKILKGLADPDLHIHHLKTSLQMHHNSILQTAQSCFLYLSQVLFHRLLFNKPPANKSQCLGLFFLWNMTYSNTSSGNQCCEGSVNLRGW